MSKRNLTLQLDDEVIRKARVVAAKRGTSVSALVGWEIVRLVEADERYELAMQRAQRAMATAKPRGGRTWTREDLYDS